MSTDETLVQLTTDAIEKLRLAWSELFKLPRNDKFEKYDIAVLGRSIGLIREFQKPIFERHPELKPPLPDDCVPDPPLTQAQIGLVNQLNKTDIKEIDDTLLSNTSRYWQKMAFVVGKTMMNLSARNPEIPDIYYAQRIRHLVKQGKLESQGTLACMRYCEIRLPLHEANK